MLRHIMVASSARHMHNLHAFKSTAQNPFPSHASKQFRDDSTIAESKAISDFVLALDSINTSNTDAILASLLLFIEFELMDLSRDTWRKHMNGARTVVHHILQSEPMHTEMSFVRRTLLANWLV